MAWKEKRAVDEARSRKNTHAYVDLLPRSSHSATYPTPLTHSPKGRIAGGMTVGKYLVIGGTGGIGRMLANRLVMKYHKVSMREAGKMDKARPGGQARGG